MNNSLSTLNFRDLGGLQTGDGHYLRSHLLYRCEGPGSFSPDHTAALRMLNIRLICDLRADVERSAAPNHWNESARLMNFSVAEDVRAASARGWNALREDPSAAGARTAVRCNYTTIPSALRPRLVELIDAITNGDTPVLIHCTAGKDRTGVLVALLLAWLGVAQDVIDADYLESHVFTRNHRARDTIAEVMKKTFGFAPDDSILAVIMGVDREFLHASFDAVRAQWGSVDGYFSSVGLGLDRQRAFRDLILEA